MTTSRREFFKTAAMGAVGAGAAFGTVAAEAKAAAPSKYDIIILGAGCGGLTCAVRAAENGLKPLLLEKMAMPAGNTIYAAGFLLVRVSTKVERFFSENGTRVADVGTAVTP